MLLLSLVTIAGTALIPIFLWRLGAKQTERDSILMKRQTETLARQERIVRRQRRDSLLELVDRSSGAAQIRLLWREVSEFDGEDKDLLLAVFRTNVALALPGTSTGVKVEDDFTDTVVSHYVGGLERRYTQGSRGIHPYRGLLDFIEAARTLGAQVEESMIVPLVTGTSAECQRPDHGFYRHLVNALPCSAGGLLHAVEDIDSHRSGGLKLNVLTGTLLAVKDAETGQSEHSSTRSVDPSQELKESVPVALAYLLDRDNLRSFDQWSLEGSTESASATVAWLIRAVGWLADADEHLAKRMIQNLAAAIQSIPAVDRGWGTDARDVQQGFEWIRRKQPTVWEAYGADMASAAKGIGQWEADEHDNE